MEHTSDKFDWENDHAREGEGESIKKYLMQLIKNLYFTWQFQNKRTKNGVLSIKKNTCHNL
jgi:hypothetical protein